VSNSVRANDVAVLWNGVLASLHGCVWLWGGVLTTKVQGVVHFPWQF
jgi:hypothetical protein